LHWCGSFSFEFESNALDGNVLLPGNKIRKITFKDVFHFYILCCKLKKLFADETVINVQEKNIS